MKFPLERVKQCLLTLTLYGFVLLHSTSLAIDPATAGCPAVNTLQDDNPILIEETGRVRTHLGEVMSMTVEQTLNGVVTHIQVRASRHHIIPYNRLRLFFNTVIRRSGTQEGLLQLRTFARGLHHLVTTGRNVYDINNGVTVQDLQLAEQLVNQIYNGEITINTRRYTADQMSAISILHTLFLWMPGNIFVGPVSQQRYDDPGREIETESDMIVGERTHQTLINLNLLMEAYINNQNTVYFVDQRRHVDVTMNLIVTLLTSLRNVITLSPTEAWMEVTPNRFGISRGAQFRWVNVVDVQDEEEHNAELRKRRSTKRIIKTLPDMPDPFCILAVESLDIHDTAIVIVPSKGVSVVNDTKHCPRNVVTFQGAGAGAGAAAGAIAGSAVPVIGTLVGAGIGAIIGFTTGTVTAVAMSC